MITVIVPKNSSVVLEMMDDQGELINQFQVTHGSSRIEVRNITDGSSRGKKGLIFERRVNRSNGSALTQGTPALPETTIPETAAAPTTSAAD